jgi:hypothetical protein
MNKKPDTRPALLGAMITDLLLAVFIVAISLNAYFNPHSSALAQTQNQVGVVSSPTPTNASIQPELAIGILKLEGTASAVTPSQARIMFPLWQALNSLSTNNNTSPAEISAIFQQVESSLTPEQTSAIAQMNWRMSDLQALEQQYAVSNPSGSGLSGLGLRKLALARQNLGDWNQVFASAVIQLLQQKAFL